MKDRGKAQEMGNAQEKGNANLRGKESRSETSSKEGSNWGEALQIERKNYTDRRNREQLRKQKWETKLKRGKAHASKEKS